MPCTGPPLVSASVQVFVSRSPSPFRVPSVPFSRYAYERSVVLLGGGLFCLGGSSTSCWTPPGSRSPQRVHVCRFPPSLVGSLSPCIGPLTLQFGVISFGLRDIPHEFDGLLSLGPFVAAGSRIGWPSPLPD